MSDMPEVVEASPEVSAAIASRAIARALVELDHVAPSHDLDHVRMHLDSALIWLRP